MSAMVKKNPAADLNQQDVIDRINALAVERTALYRKASELLTRANKSGRIEGPVGLLPNPRKRKNPDPIFGSLRDAEKRGAKRALVERRSGTPAS